MSRESYDNLIIKLGEQIALEGLKADEEGYCCLAFDEKIIVHIQYNYPNDAIMFFCQIGQLNEESQKRLRKKILRADFLWQGTAGTTIGVDNETGEVMMAYQVGMESLNMEGFQEALKGFVETAEKWMRALEALERGESVPELEELENNSAATGTEGGAAFGEQPGIKA